MVQSNKIISVQVAKIVSVINITTNYDVNQLQKDLMINAQIGKRTNSL